MPPSTKRVGRNDRRSRSRLGPGSRSGARAPRVRSPVRGFARSADPGRLMGVRRCRAIDRIVRGGVLCGSWIGPAGYGCLVGSLGSSNGTSRRATPFDPPSPAVVTIALGGLRPHRGLGSRVGRPRGPSAPGSPPRKARRIRRAGHPPGRSLDDLGLATTVPWPGIPHGIDPPSSAVLPVAVGRLPGQQPTRSAQPRSSPWKGWASRRRANPMNHRPAVAVARGCRMAVC